MPIQYEFVRWPALDRRWQARQYAVCDARAGGGDVMRRLENSGRFRQVDDAAARHPWLASGVMTTVLALMVTWRFHPVMLIAAPLYFVIAGWSLARGPARRSYNRRVARRDHPGPGGQSQA